MCVECVYYGCVPASPAVDRLFQSKDEADALCVRHRARCTEGLCGRREPWVSPWPDSDIGACELCFRVVFGKEQGDAVAHQLLWLRRLAA